MSLPKVKDFVQTMELVMMVIVLVYMDIPDSIVKQVGLISYLNWHIIYISMCTCVCVCVCVLMFMCACVRACMRGRMRVCV